MADKFMAALAAFLLKHMPALPLPAHLSHGASLALALALPLVGGVGLSAATAKEITGWYRTLNKPSWTPPNWLFGPVWTTLYVLMGVASHRVFALLGPSGAGRHLSVYLLQLLLNFAWTPTFFKFHALGPATVVSGLMWLAILGTIAVFSTVLGARAAWLFLGPYLAWVSYASALTAWIWRHNPVGTVVVVRPRRAAAAKKRAA